MSTGLIDIIKRASTDAVEAGKPTDLRFGIVKSTSPLSIQVTHQFTIPESMLIVPEHLTDYTKKVTFDWETETVPAHSHSYSGSTQSSSGGSGESAFSSHGHAYSGTTGDANSHKHKMISNKSKTITIHAALQEGEKVALLRKQGGQSYYILDRV